jgi:ribosomal protein L37E
MATVTASATRTADYTEAHRCRKCARAFWSKRSWNAVTVECPHCGTGN